MTRAFYRGHEIHERMRCGERWFTVDQRTEPTFSTCEAAAHWIDENLDPAVHLTGGEFIDLGDADPPATSNDRDGSG